MAVGDEAKAAIRSYIALGKESTYGTYNTATTAVLAVSCGFRTDIESQKLETLNVSRDFARRIQTMKNVGGSLETYLHPNESVLLVATAMGGGIANTSQSGVAIHTLTAGNFDTSPSSLCFSVRKAHDAVTFNYSGGRPNVLTISGEVGEPIKLTAEFIFKDSTVGSDIVTSLSVSSLAPFVYHQGQYIYAANQSALTTTSVEPIQAFELTINNNLVSDESARQLGTNVLTVLPATQREINLNITQRWDTSTNYNRFIQATEGAVRIILTGSTITSSSSLEYKWQIDLPKVLMNSPDPELGGASEILQSEIAFDVVSDSPLTTTGKAIVITVWDNVNSY